MSAVGHSVCQCTANHLIFPKCRWKERKLTYPLFCDLWRSQFCLDLQMPMGIKAEYLIYFEDINIFLLLPAVFFSVSWDSLLLFFSCFKYLLCSKLTASLIFTIPFTIVCTLHKCNCVPHYIYLEDRDPVEFSAAASLPSNLQTRQLPPEDTALFLRKARNERKIA